MTYGQCFRPILGRFFTPIEFPPSFDENVADIFERLPKKRQTLLFTATVTEALEKLREGEKKKEGKEGKRPMFFYTVWRKFSKI